MMLNGLLVAESHAKRLGELRKQLFDSIGLGLAGMNDVDVDVVAVAERGKALG